MSNILRTAAELMALAARTAPKAAGKDFVVLEILEGEQLNKLADAMVEYGRQTGRKNFDRDGENVRRSAAVLLIGLKKPQKTKKRGHRREEEELFKKDFLFSSPPA